MANEFNRKQESIRGLLEAYKLDALLLCQSANFAWATCGASSYINRADSSGVASLLITSKDRYVLTNNIESTRLLEEEGLEVQGWELRVCPWYEQDDAYSRLVRGLKVGSDTGFGEVVDVSAEIRRLRSRLTPEEGERFRELGRLCAAGMRDAVDAIRPGMTEFEIAAELSQGVERRGVEAIINLVGTDERIFAYRHPLPTARKLQRYGMLVLCGRKWGLVCSLTRLIYFGGMPDDVRCKAEAAACIDAHMIAATRPANTMGDVFHAAQAAYASSGYPDEWKMHHQGGSVGYMPRESTATPSSTDPIYLGQAYAWNPSISGVKSEDTILVTESNNEIITEIPGWPALSVQVGNQTIRRPAVLERGLS